MTDEVTTKDIAEWIIGNSLKTTAREFELAGEEVTDDMQKNIDELSTLLTDILNKFVYYNIK